MRGWPGLLGRSLQERIQRLEADLHPEVRLNDYHDMPCAIFLYHPSDEFEMRAEIQLLRTRLENKGKSVQVISLATVMQESLEVTLGPDGLAELYAAEQSAYRREEGRDGVEQTIRTVEQIVNDLLPVDKLVAEQLHALDPNNCVAFLTRADALYPVYRTSALLDRLLTERVEVPTVLFYPGDLEGVNGLRFMGALEAEHNYRARIY